MANVVVDIRFPIPVVALLHSLNSANTRSVVGVELGAVAAVLHGCGRAVWIVCKNTKVGLAVVGSNS